MYYSREIFNECIAIWSSINQSKLCLFQSCRAEFCWVCLGKWKNHDYSSCSKYDADETVEARNNQEKSRAALERYLFYWDRYTNHIKSLSFENKLYDSVKVRRIYVSVFDSTIRGVSSYGVDISTLGLSLTGKMLV